MLKRVLHSFPRERLRRLPRPDDAGGCLDADRPVEYEGFGGRKQYRDRLWILLLPERLAELREIPGRSELSKWGPLGAGLAEKHRDHMVCFYQHKNWDVGILQKRVGTMYNDNGSLTYNINGAPLAFPVDQAVTINPFDLTNFFANYTIKNEGWLRGSKIGFAAANNLFDNHNIVGISPATKPTLSAPFVPNAGDIINLLPGRSVMVTLTVGYAPAKR